MLMRNVGFMQLPEDILSNLNRQLSRHPHPDALDWQRRNGKWTAWDGDRSFTLIHDEKLGYVVAEVKSVSCGVQ
jgi:hypothetical protein